MGRYFDGICRIDLFNQNIINIYDTKINICNINV